MCGDQSPPSEHDQLAWYTEEHPKLEDKLERYREALDALRWQNADGSYEDDCWCDVKNVDDPNWHSPSCLAAREALDRQETT
jgi:hypothetical protein